MPIGSRRVGVASGPAVGPRDPGSANTAGAFGGSPGQRGPGGADDVDNWEHATLRPAEADGGILVQFGTPVSRIRVLVRDSSAVMLGSGRIPGTSAGSYDLVHPGMGELDLTIPPTSSLGVKRDPAAPALANNVEVYGLAGWYADRPV